VKWATLMRALFIQGSWNYRSMLGLGMAWAMLPALRWRAHRSSGSARAAELAPVTLQRHVEPFNSHPYLASMALGSLIRLEADGASDDTIRRFRAAVRGPLGALGDRLVWATWLPLCSLLGVLVLLSGASPWIAGALFLGVYNTGHIALRIWGFSAGYAEGPRLAARLKSAGLSQLADRLGSGVALLAGLTAGLLLAGRPWPSAALSDVDLRLTGLGLVGLALGLTAGPRAWRPAAFVTVAALGLLFMIGLLGLGPGAN
jgi:PTS system mannose-specific IID component